MGRGVARTFLSAARAAPNVVVYSTAALEESADTDWIARFEGQDFSLADAVTFAVMTERGMPKR
jgi:predicted nucleic acid-binding protein